MVKQELRPSKLLKQFVADLLDAAHASRSNKLVIFEAEPHACSLCGGVEEEKVILLGIIEEVDGKTQLSPIAEMVWDAHEKYRPHYPLLMITNHEDIIIADPDKTRKRTPRKIIRR